MSTDERFDRIDASIGDLKQYLIAMRTETINRLDIIENRLDTLTNTVHSIDLRLPALSKAIADFGSVATRLTRDHAALEAKVSKLVDPAA
jgi:3-dehydroquinate dehydratase